MYASLSSTPSSHTISIKESINFASLFLIRSRQKTSRANPILDWASSLSLKRLRRSPVRIQTSLVRIQTSPVRIQARSVLLTGEAHHEDLKLDGLDLEEQQEKQMAFLQTFRLRKKSFRVLEDLFMKLVEELDRKSIGIRILAQVRNRYHFVFYWVSFLTYTYQVLTYYKKKLL